MIQSMTLSEIWIKNYHQRKTSMKLSFKYKFILSFVTIEILFISLIVFYNFASLNNLSKSLIEEKIETSSELFTEIVKAPLIVHDLAMLDNALESFSSLKNVAAVEILDNHNRVISQAHDDVVLYKNIFNNDLLETENDDRTFRLSILPVKLENKLLGNVKIIYEITNSLKVIKENRNFTFFLVLLEIIILTIISYIIGYRLAGSLSVLTESARQIAQDDQIIIPDIKSSSYEISVLSDALHIMQQRIARRNKTLNNLVKKMKKERDFHRALLDQASSIVVVMNKKGEIVLTNKIVEKLTGYAQSEIEGKVAWEVFIPQENREKVKEVFFNLVAGDFPSSYENAWIVKDGSQVPFAWSNSCITDENKEIEYVITVGIDITERKKIDRTIKALLNSPLDSIILISVDETILEVNEIAAKRLKSTPDQLKGKKLYDYTPDSVTEIRRRYMDEVLVTKNPVVFEKTINGRIYKSHLYPILDNNGNVIQISIFSHDITEHRKSKAELEKYIKLVDENVMISHTDTEGITTSVSKAFCKITGYKSEELIGKKFDIIRHRDMPESLYQELWETIQKGRVWSGEIKNRKKDGRFYWVNTSVYPDFDDEGNIIGYNAIRQDITDKKLIEELSITDSLTKLYNRRYFDDIFDTEISRAKRDRKIFCLISLDVDNFKLYNDTYGHHRGDNVLMTIAHVLKNSMKRAGDYAFRIGGEEFSAICAVTDEKSVYDFADRIRRSIENKRIEHKSNTVSSYVTVSIGVVFIDFSKNENVATDKLSLYNHADALLYKAKDKGRNVVVVDEIK